MRLIYGLSIVLLWSCSKDDGVKIDREVFNNQLYSGVSVQPNDAEFLPSGDILTLTTYPGLSQLKCKILSAEDGSIKENYYSTSNTGLFGRDLMIYQNENYVLGDIEVSTMQRNVILYKLNSIYYEESSLVIPSEHSETAVKIIPKNQMDGFLVLVNRKDKDTDKRGFVLYDIYGNNIEKYINFPHPILQSGSDLIAKKDGSGYYVFGHSIEDVDRSTDFVLYELNNNLELVKKVFFGGGEYEEARQILEDDLGQVYLFGHSASQDILHQMVLFKLDQSLNLIYEKHFGSSYHDGGQTLCFDGSNKLTLIGRTDAPDDNNENVYIVKISTDGQVIDEFTLGDNSNNRADIVLNKNGVDYIIGYNTVDQDFKKNIDFYKVRIK